MKWSLLEFLVCPLCTSDLELKSFIASEGWIEEGLLICQRGDRFPVIQGIPILIEPSLRFAILKEEEARFWERYGGYSYRDSLGVLSIEKKSAAEVWGYQWQVFYRIWQDEARDEQFHRFVFPVRPEHFRQRIILDVGCGMGRHILSYASNAKIAIGVDISLSVRVASRLTRKFPNAHIVQADICQLPFRLQTFDLVYSIGVIHHLPDPKSAYFALLSKVKKRLFCNYMGLWPRKQLHCSLCG